MKHIILGDVHLGKGVNIGKPGNNKVLNSRLQDQSDLLYYTSNMAEENNFGHIIITGDIYQDSRPHPAIVNLFMKWLKHCESKNIKIDIIVGNHDIMRTGSYTVSALDLIPTMELPHATIHKNVTSLKFDNVDFLFVPFRDKRMYEVNNTEDAVNKLLEEINAVKIDRSKTNVMVGHLALEGCLEIGDEISDTLHEIFFPLNAFKNFDYIWMGHIHHPQVLQKENPYCAHVGSMDRSDFGKNETSRDKILVIFDDSSKSFEHHPLPTRRLIHIDINVPADKDSTDFVINTLAVLDTRDAIKDAIVRLDIQLLGGNLLNVERGKVEEYIYNSLNAFHICKISESRVLNILPTESAKNFSSDDSVMDSLKQWTGLQEFDCEEDKFLFEQYTSECVAEFESKL